MPKIAGVVVDNYKLPVFRRIITEAGYKFTEHVGVTHDTTTIKVEYDFVYKLQPFIEKANKEATK